MTARYACMIAQNFPLQAVLRLRPELQKVAVAVLDGEPPFEQVCSLNYAAMMLGVTVSMTKLEMEMFPTVVILPRSHAQEATGRDALLECAGSFSPLVENQSSDGCFLCVLDIAGMETLFGSPDALGEKLLKMAQLLCVEVSVAISSNFYNALYMARSLSPGTMRVVPLGMECSALAPLPLSVLHLSQELAETFSLWGISTLGALANLKETELIARLGQQGKQLRLLARGAAPHLFTAIEPAFSLQERIELDTPIELLDSLLFMIGVMLDQVMVRAQARILALASITLQLELDGGASHTRTVQPALPNLDRRLWLKLIHLDLQAHPPQAAILGMSLRAKPGTTSKVQLGLFSPQVPEPMKLDVTLARIRNIVGEGCVGHPVLKDTHRPDAFRVESFAVPTTPAMGKKPGTQRVAMRQLRPAEVVTVSVRDQQPESFVFREKRYTVEHAYGPWSSGGDWWKPTLWCVEQWDLVARAQSAAQNATQDATQDQASWLCCCLTHDLSNTGDDTGSRERWLVEALYD